MPTDFRPAITAALAQFHPLPLKAAARQLLATLGYRSERTLSGPDSSPASFLALFGKNDRFSPEKALLPEWKSADLLFQLTDQELSRESSLFTDTTVKAGLLKSYVFIAIELARSDYPRGAFSAIARQINRLFPMPVMVLFKHGDRLTIAVINRRRNKLYDSKDVLEKATLIREIALAQPHRGHLDILASDNDRWKQTQLAKLDSAPMREELERAFADNNDDYDRKLTLIENCLYGVDIQPIAIQNTRFQQQPTAPRRLRHRPSRKRRNVNFTASIL